ncbi:thermonuclease family protein [Alsobacter metallidurans]|uniref:thermonuclease family protein n=1 Tax=Alsobacter metallidurans TaxID=340221 RepID=UPI0016699326|nr:thermonuclease family protein [Alsobacter metallidurans]
MALIAGVLLAAAIGLVATMGDRLSQPPVPPPPPVEIAAPPPVPAPASKIPPPTVLAVVSVEGPFDPVDSVSFTSKANGEIILDEVIGPGPEAVCADTAKLRWACGLRARAALANQLRDQTLSCEVVERLEKRRIRARCKGREGDLARIMVANGWARSSEGAEPKYERETQAAKTASAGLWAGGWTIVLEGRRSRTAKPKS